MKFTPRFMPFLINESNLEVGENYTAVIYVQIGSPVTPNNALYKLIKTISKSQFVDRVSSRVTESLLHVI